MVLKGLLLCGCLAYGCNVLHELYLDRRAVDLTLYRQYVVDYSPIGKPGAFVHLRPSINWRFLSILFPRNGQVVFAKEVPLYPDWLELRNGRFIIRKQCGIELVRPVADEKAK